MLKSKNQTPESNFIKINQKLYEPNQKSKKFESLIENAESKREKTESKSER